MADTTPSPGNQQPDSPDLRFGLSRAIQLHSEEFRIHCPQVKLDLDLIEDENLLPVERCQALYQIYQAALDRAACQAQASMVSVRYYPSARFMVLDIRDSEEKAPVPVDLPTLQAKLQADVEGFGGQVQAAPYENQGTRITVKIPFPA